MLNEEQGSIKEKDGLEAQNQEGAKEKGDIAPNYKETKELLKNSTNGAEDMTRITGYIAELENLIGEKKDLSKLGVKESSSSDIVASISFDTSFDGDMNHPDASLKYLARIYVICQVFETVNVKKPEDIIKLITSGMTVDSFGKMDSDWKDVLLESYITITHHNSNEQNNPKDDTVPYEPDKIENILDFITKNTGVESIDSSSNENTKDTNTQGGKVDNRTTAEKLGLTNNNIERLNFINEFKQLPDPIKIQVMMTICWGSEEEISDVIVKTFPDNKFIDNIMTVTEPLRDIASHKLANIKEIGLKIEQSAIQPSENVISNLLENSLELDDMNKKISTIMSFSTNKKIGIPKYRTNEGITGLLKEIYKQKGWQVNFEGKNMVEKFSTENMEAKGIASKDLTQEAKNGEFDKFSVNNNVINKLWATLGRTNMKSGVLIGEAGSGKTTAIEVLAREISKGNIPDALKERYRDYTVLGISAGELAGNEYQNSGKEFIKAMLKDCTNKPVILFVDELHSIFESGVDINEFKADMASGKITIIGATTPEEWKNVIGIDEAFMSRIDQIPITSTPEERWQIIDSQARHLEKDHNIKFSDYLMEILKSEYPDPNPRDVVTTLDKCASIGKLEGSREIGVREYKKFLVEREELYDMMDAA